MPLFAQGVVIGARWNKTEEKVFFVRLLQLKLSCN